MSPGGPVCFYGDDFTGATAHLAGFHEAGLNALMFLRTPTLAQAQRHLADEDVLGVAGISRSLAPAAMGQEIGPAFALFRALGARQAHYKICSTFDSSPRLGSIGRAIEIGRAPGVIQVTFLAPLSRLDAIGLGKYAREQYGF